MSDQDFFFDDDQPVEPKAAPVKSGKATGKGGNQSAKSAVKRPPTRPASKPAPKAASVSASQSVPLIVTILVAVLTLLLGIIIGILISPALSAAPAANVGVPVDSTGTAPMGMGGGGMAAPVLTDDQIQQGMPEGHVPVDPNAPAEGEAAPEGDKPAESE